MFDLPLSLAALVAFLGEEFLESLKLLGPAFVLGLNGEVEIVLLDLDSLLFFHNFSLPLVAHELHEGTLDELEVLPVVVLD